MPHDLQQQAAPPRPVENQTHAQPTAPSLEAALAVVRRDSRRDAQSYLEETVVPHGGE